MTNVRLTGSIRRSKLAFFLSAGCLLLASLCGFAADQLSEVTTIDDILVAKYPRRKLFMDVAYPKTGNGPFPLVVCIHGGAWVGGNRKSLREQMLNLAKTGFTSASIEYRFEKEAKFPAQINDAADAINYLIQNAEKYKINPDKIGLFGGSAGGQIALMLAVSQNDIDKKHLNFTRVNRPIKAVVSLAGPTNLTHKFSPYLEKIVNGLFPNSHHRNASKLALDRVSASPIYYVDGDDTPILLIHGTNDEIVPYPQSVEFVEANKRVNKDVELVAIKDAGHGGGGEAKAWHQAISRMMEFLKSHL